jgi:hypothetical protein
MRKRVTDIYEGSLNVPSVLYWFASSDDSSRSGNVIKNTAVSAEARILGGKKRKGNGAWLL